MEVIAGGINGKYLKGLLHGCLKDTQEVKAAVAYANGNPELFEYCWQNKLPLTFYGRYESSVPVSTAILEQFLKRSSGNYVCRLVPDIFHAKIIYWVGYGAYIGSANLTDRAWYGNIELGIFMYQDELDGNGLSEQIDQFFDFLNSNSHPLSKEVYDELCEFEKTQFAFRKQTEKNDELFKKKRKLPTLFPLLDLSPKAANDKNKATFLTEWYEALTILRNIAHKATEDKYRPTWIDPATPAGAQADQFLHGYYYTFVKQGQKAIHRDLHDKNKNNTDRALEEALLWWKGQALPPYNEDKNLLGATVIRETLKEDQLEALDLDRFIVVCQNIHALKEHCSRVRKTTLGLPIDDYTPQDQRLVLLARWIYSQRSQTGKSVVELIRRVLYGGKINDTPERIFEAVYDESWCIPHFGISTIGELVGWALPEHFPPRNGRTSKALVALGYKVRVFSE